MVVSNVVALAVGIGLSILTVYLASTSQTAPVCGPGFCHPPPPPIMTPFAQIDPLVGLLSALPNGNGGTVLGSIGLIHHAFGLRVTLQDWQAFGIVAFVVSVILLLLTTRLIRAAPPWLSDGA